MKLRALVPPFLAGACLAVAAAVSVGLLLYAGAGFLRALATIIATLLLALSLGIWFGYGGPEKDPVERARRLWLFTLFSFTLAVLFSAGWELVEDLPVDRLVQGLGLALLGGLPLFAGGALLGSMVRPDSPLVPPRGSRAPGPGSAAVAGAGVGVVMAGVVFFPGLSSTAILLLCIVALSGGALLHGWTLDSRFLPRVVVRQVTADGELAVVVEVRGRPRALRRVLLQDGRVRAAEDEEGRPVRPVEQALLDWLDRHLAGDEGAGDGETQGPFRRILHLGGGASRLPALVAESRPGVEVVVVEESRLLLDFAREHFVRSKPPEEDAADGEEGEEERGRVRQGDWVEATTGLPAPFDLVLVDVGALFPLAPISRLTGGALKRLGGLVAPGGALLLAGISSPDEGDGRIAHKALVGPGPAPTSGESVNGAERLDGSARLLAQAAGPIFSRAAVERTGADPYGGAAASTVARDRRDLLVLLRDPTAQHASPHDPDRLGGEAMG